MPNKAINLNSRDYYVTGTTTWDNGKVRQFDDYKHDPIVCPCVCRYGPEVLTEVRAGAKQFLKIPAQCVGYTIVFETCVKLTAADHAEADGRAEEFFNQL